MTGKANAEYAATAGGGKGPIFRSIDEDVLTNYCRRAAVNSPRDSERAI